MRTLQSQFNISQLRQQFEVWNDFHHFATGQAGWTSLAADTTSTVAHSDAAGGILVLTNSNTDNNECSIFTTTEPFLFGADRTIFAEVRLQFTELTGGASNVAFGFGDTMGAANFIADNGAQTVGHAVSGASSAVIYKIDGGTVWRAAAEVNDADINDTVSVQTAGGASYQRLGIEVRAVTSTEMEVTYFLNGYALTDSNNRPIKHTVTYTSATEMNFGVYAKTGTTEEQVVNVDYLYAAMKRT
jgi:hypothetical protein